MKLFAKQAVALTMLAVVMVFQIVNGQSGIGIRTLKSTNVLPFNENWNSGTFAMYGWQFSPGQANWIINTASGNPLPAVEFTGTPALTNYNVLLYSMPLEGIPWVCAEMFLEFDYKLTDIAANGSEKLTAEYFVDGNWIPLVDLLNGGSSGSWIHLKLNISAVSGRYFKIGFRASGQNCGNIGGWMIDNITVNPVCLGPTACTYIKSADSVHLFWQPPQCDSLQYILGYNVYRSEDPAFISFAKINATPVVSLEYTDIIPIGYPHNRFRYFITAIHIDPATNTYLCEAPCDTMEVDLSIGIGNLSRTGIIISPVPASHDIRIQSDTPLEPVELLSCPGEKLLTVPTGGSKSCTFSVGNYPNGIYLLRIKNASGTFIRKVALMH